MRPAPSLDRANTDGAVLGRLQAATIELRAVLDAEHEALMRRDALALDAATCAKSELLRRIEALDRERGLRRGRRAAPADHAPAWQGLGRQLEECRRLNEANGSLVARQLAFVRRALDVLNGAGDGPPLLYGPGGHAETQRAARPLSQA